MRTTFRHAFHTLFGRWLPIALPLLLASCGGGGGYDSSGGSASCSIGDQKAWLKSYMDDRYFWYSLIPNVNAASYASIDSYFDALLYPGGNPTFPADRWSFTESTDAYNQFFGDGKTLGYGLFVAGLEVAGHPELPLRVRYIEPQSPAATAGIVRGETIVSVNGHPASELITNNDFTLLTPAQTGDALNLVVRNASGDRNVNLVATVFTLTPVGKTSVVSTTGGKKMGYLMLKDFIDQSATPMDSAFAQFKAAGVSEVVLDLRYNGGGLVSVARDLASYVGGAPLDGKVFTSLLYSDRHPEFDTDFRFKTYLAALGAQRVFVLTGQRTCSASELVVNGLRPFINVVLVGDTTCGKPVGFNPASNCATTFNAVNFESVNANNAGRYWDGFAPTCPAADDLDHALGDASEGLLAAAGSYADAGSCPAGLQRERPQALRAKGVRSTEPGDRRGMIGR